VRLWVVPVARPRRAFPQVAALLRESRINFSRLCGI